MHHGVIFNLALLKCIYLPYLRHVSLIKIYICIAATYNFMYFYIIVLFPLTAGRAVGGKKVLRAVSQKP